MKYFKGYRFWYTKFFNQHMYANGQPKAITEYFKHVKNEKNSG